MIETIFNGKLTYEIRGKFTFYYYMKNNFTNRNTNVFLERNEGI
jgi:hypothetical protein